MSQGNQRHIHNAWYIGDLGYNVQISLCFRGISVQIRRRSTWFRIKIFVPFSFGLLKLRIPPPVPLWPRVASSRNLAFTLFCNRNSVSKQVPPLVIRLWDRDDRVRDGVFVLSSTVPCLLRVKINHLNCFGTTREYDADRSLGGSGSCAHNSTISIYTTN